MLARTQTVEPKTVNGVNVDHLLSLIEGVRGDAAKGKTQWRVKSAWRARLGAVHASRALRSADNTCHASSQSTLMSRANSVGRISSPIPRNICWQRSTPA
jgi:hypothetical protein